MTPPIKLAQHFLSALLLALICVSNVAYKNYLLEKQSVPDLSDAEGFFWTEGAFHFRHFMMIAQGEAIPALDTQIQFPEGLSTRRYITPMMEHVMGRIYRVGFEDMAPHMFIVRFQICFTALSVLAVFLAAKFTWRSSVVGLLCAFIYAILPAAVMRTAGGNYIREDFALPFIFLSFAGWMFCMRCDRADAAIITSISFVIALAAWHVSQLYLSIFMLAIALSGLATGFRYLPRKSLSIFVGILAVASLLFPVLREKWFVFSPALMLGYGLIASTLILPRKKFSSRNTFLLGALMLISALGLALLIQASAGTYSHVYVLLLNKLKFLGVLPEDPALMPFEARVMWTSSFVSPRIDEIGLLMLAALPLGVLGWCALFGRTFNRTGSASELLILIVSLAMFVLFIMVHRMSIFASFFLTLSAGALFGPLGIAGGRGRLKMAIFAVGIIAQLSMITRVRPQSFRPAQRVVNPVYEFLRDNTDPGAAVLSAFQFGPGIAAYADRPVTLQPKFESKQIRDKVEEVYRALYDSETRFAEVCERHGVKIFIFDYTMAIGQGGSSPQYYAGVKNLPVASAAFQFFFTPENLTRFQLIGQMSTFRIFSLLPYNPVGRPDIEYEPIFDLFTYLEDEPPGDVIAGEVFQHGLSKLRDPTFHGRLGRRFLSRLELQKAELQFRRALQLNPEDLQSGWGLGVVKIHTGSVEEALTILYRALEIDQEAIVTDLNIGDPHVLAAMGQYEFARKRYERAERIYRQAVDLESGHQEALLGLGSVLLQLMRSEEALQVATVATHRFPDNAEAFENLARAYAILEDFPRAVSEAEKSLAINPENARLQAVLAKLRSKAREVE